MFYLSYLYLPFHPLCNAVSMLVSPFKEEAEPFLVLIGLSLHMTPVVATNSWKLYLCFLWRYDLLCATVSHSNKTYPAYHCVTTPVIWSKVVTQTSSPCRLHVTWHLVLQVGIFGKCLFTSESKTMRGELISSLWLTAFAVALWLKRPEQFDLMLIGTLVDCVVGLRA